MNASTTPNPQYAQALARHAKAALLHLRQAEDLAELAGVDLYAYTSDVPEAGLLRAAGEAVEDLDLWAVNNARAAGADPAVTYQDTGRWCQAEGGHLPAGSWPGEPDPGAAALETDIGEYRDRRDARARAEQDRRDREKIAFMRGLNWLGDGLPDPEAGQ